MSLKNIPLLSQPDEFTFETLSQDPPVLYLPKLLTAEECQHLIELGRPLLKPSTMVWEDRQFVDLGRQSETASLLKCGDTQPADPVVRKLLEKLSRYCGYPLSHFEALQLLRYQQGGYYVPHHDYFSNEQPSFIQKNGDRCLTFFIYLNDLKEEDGGGTYFPELGFEVIPQQGDGLFWMNMDAGGNYYEKTRHGGQPVLGAVEKWALNLWVREYAFKTLFSHA